MQKVSDEIVKLLRDPEALTEARMKALKITNGIEGFGSSVKKSSSPTSSSSSEGSISTTSSPTMFHSNRKLNKQQQDCIGNNSNINIVLPPRDLKHVTENHLLIESKEDEDVEKPKGFVGEIYSKMSGVSPVKGEKRGKVEFRCLSDVGSKVNNHKKFDRQYSLWF